MYIMCMWIYVYVCSHGTPASRQWDSVQAPPEAGLPWTGSPFGGFHSSGGTHNGWLIVENLMNIYIYI